MPHTGSIVIFVFPFRSTYSVVTVQSVYNSKPTSYPDAFYRVTVLPNQQSDTGLTMIEPWQAFRIRPA